MVDVKLLKCPACGSSEIEQQSEKLVKCSHCGSSLILKGNFLTSVKEHTSKASLETKQPLFIIATILVIGLIALFIGYHHDEVLPVVGEPLIETKPNHTIVDPIELEKRKQENESTFIPNIEIIHQVQGKTIVGGIYWIVQIKNISSNPVSRSRVVVSLFDEDDKRIEEQSGWSIKEVLQPNETSVVLVLVAKPPKQMATFEFSANASKLNFLLKNQVAMEVVDFVVNQNNERYEIVGDVKNPNAFTVNYTKVVAVALDVDGKPIGLAHQFSTKKTLLAGEGSGFKISSTTFVAQQPASWRLWAIARKE
jgi:DNA-directed RNA polymerase subunit RPC12/RpoP